MLALRRLPTLSLFVLLAMAQAGCLIVEAKVDANGAGTMKIVASRLDEPGDERIREQLASPSVKLLDASMAEGIGTYEVAFTDVTKLRTAPLLRDLRVDLEGEGSAPRTLSLHIPRRERSDELIDLPADDYVVLDLTLALPGAIVETNGEKLEAAKVRWRLRVADVLGKGSLEARVVYQTAAAAPAS